MWCWSRRDISLSDRVRKKVSQIVKDERNILQSIKRKKANWIGHTLLRNCLPLRSIEGMIEVG